MPRERPQTTLDTPEPPESRKAPAESSMIHVGSLEALEQAGQMLVRGADRPVVVFYNGGDVRAVDNRCPHMGFPLHKGSCENGMITCHWHHARFDAASGCTFDLWADDVDSYPTLVKDGQVYVARRPRPRDAVAHATARLRDGMQQNIGLIMAKSILALRAAGIAPDQIIREAALFSCANRDAWASGLTTLTMVANLLPHLSEQTAYLALFKGVRAAASDAAGQAPRRKRQPLDTDQLPLDQLDRWLRYWTTVRHRDGAERTLLTAVSTAGANAAARLLFAAAVERFYASGGHTLDFANKAFELLDHIGQEHAESVLPALVSGLVSGRGGEELNEWRHPIDLVPLVRGTCERLPSRFERGSGKTWNSESQLAHAMLADNPHAVLTAIEDAAGDGAQPVQLAKALAYAAAMRVARFGTSNEIGDWFTALHTFTYCNAMHQALVRCPDAGLVPGVVHGAMSVYLDRFLNVPPAKLPWERGKLDDLPTEPEALCAAFLVALDSQHQVDRAAQVVARYLQLGRPVGPLVDAMVQSVVREDFDFHTLQMLEAAVRQHSQWPAGSVEANTILVAAARYIAAFSPTQRAQFQTARIALRLHRGDEIFEDAPEA